jgi:hypothetical protein
LSPLPRPFPERNSPGGRVSASPGIGVEVGRGIVRRVSAVCIGLHRGPRRRLAKRGRESHGEATRAVGQGTSSSGVRAKLRALSRDAVILPADVAAERTGVDVETLRLSWGVQEMTRIHADGEREVALLVPNFMLKPTALPLPVRDEVDAL